MKLNHIIKISQTASSGAWSFNSPDFANCSSAAIRQILVVATTATTTFTVTITDADSNEIYKNEYPATGTLREEVNIPIKSIVTIAVSSASTDEAFTGRIAVQEA